MKLTQFATILLAWAALMAAPSAHPQQITGAGATFPAPVYARWADAYHKATGVRVNYQSLGSSAGMRQIRGRTVDFGASDAPLTAQELDKDGLIQFPTVIGGVVPVVNIPGLKPGELRLTGPVLADIYLGRIRRWNEKPIADLNPGLKLPALDIGVVRRADGSGTTFIFTNYLAKVSPDWKQKVGEGTAVQWPVGLGGRGNEGVAAFVQRLPGTIGYVESAYAHQNKLAHVMMQNAAGAYVHPNEHTFRAAAAGAQWGKTGFYEILTQQPGKDSWPIAGATFILVHRTPPKPRQLVEVLKFFDWAYVNGGKMALELDYVPMPESVVKQVRAAWAAQLKDAGGQPLWPAK
jgi:phosphate transport system substrate-binding protein